MSAKNALHARVATVEAKLDLLLWLVAATILPVWSEVFIQVAKSFWKVG